MILIVIFICLLTQNALGVKIGGYGGKIIDNTEEFFKNPVGTTKEELERMTPKAKDLWGRAGRVAMPAAEKIMKERNKKKEHLTNRMKYALRPIFGDLVDRINVRYNSKMLDKWSALGYEIRLSGVDTVGQAYGYDVFLAYPKSRFNSEPADMLDLLIHEITHVQQMRNIKNTVADFGYRYFWEFKVANLNYAENKLEKEAYAMADRHGSAAYKRYISYGNVSGMIISNKDKSLAFHANGGAKHGAQIKLHSNCHSGNADCTWSWKNGMIISRKNPSLAIHAYHGAKHGAQLRLHNNCKSSNPDCTWFWEKGMIVNGGNPSLAFHAFHGAKHGAEIRLHNSCRPNNLDCSWSYKK